METQEEDQTQVSDSVSEIALDAWSALGVDSPQIDHSLTTIQYVNTNIGQRSNIESPSNKDSQQRASTSGIYESTYEVGFECTESVGSFGSVGSIGSATADEDSITSFTSVSDEIRSCEDDVEKIIKLLELDKKMDEVKWVLENDAAVDSNSDSSPGPSTKSTNSDSAKKKKKSPKASNKKSAKGVKDRQGKKSSSPTKRKIIVCDGKVGLVGFNDIASSSQQRDKSPYKCEFFDSKKKAPIGRKYHEVIVTEKQYRLIEGCIPSAQKCNSSQVFSQDTVERQQTLFGWVAFNSASNSPSGTPHKIPSQYCRSRSRLGQFTTSDTKLHHWATCPLLRPPPKRDDKETQTFKKVVFNDHLEIETFETDSEESSKGFYGKNASAEYYMNEIVEDVVESLQKTTIEELPPIPDLVEEVDTNIDKPIPVPPANKSIDRLSLETRGEDMCLDVFAATEMSVVLINTVFKDIVLGSDVPVSLSTCPKFHDFITSGNEMEALEKAAKIYASTAEKIYEYLDSAFNPNVPCKSKVSEEENSPRPGPSSDISKVETTTTLATLSKTTGEESEVTSLSSGLVSPIGTIGRRLSDLSNIWGFATDDRPERFEMTLTSRPGLILETIDCDKWQFSISYTGEPDRVHQLGTAMREKTEPVYLNPQCLLEMIDRNSSFASSRLITSKYYMSQVAERMGPLVQDFLVGKYAKSSGSFPTRRISKFRSINVFAGILFQISVTFAIVTRKIQNSIEKAMRLDDVLRCPRLPGLKLIFDENSDIVPSSPPRKMPMKDTIQELSNCMGDIDSILTGGKNSLAAISAGIKVKRKHKKIIKLMCDAVKQLEFGHDIDFGTVMMSLACNAAVILTLSDAIPTVDIDVRSRILSSLGHLNWSASEVMKISKRISLLASFVAGKSFSKLSRYNQIQVAKRKRKEQRKSEQDYLKQQRKEERDGRSLSTRKNLERVLEQRRLEETRRQEEIQEQLDNLK